MNVRDFRKIVKYVIRSCPGLTNKQLGRLEQLRFSPSYSLRDIRMVYRTAIENGYYPECPYCHKAITDVEEFSLDHCIPKSKGGPSTLENVQPMHKTCNAIKGNELVLVEEYNITIITTIQPHKHTRSDIEKQRRKNRRIVIRGGDNLDEFIKQCDKRDSLRYNIHKSKGGKKR